MTKRKIKDRIKEHINDIKYNRHSTALSQLALKENLEIDFNNIEKIANYNNQIYSLKREAIEILTQERAVNVMAHTQVDKEWTSVLPGKKWFRQS